MQKGKEMYPFYSHIHKERPPPFKDIKGVVDFKMAWDWEVNGASACVAWACIFVVESTNEDNLI